MLRFSPEGNVSLCGIKIDFTQDEVSEIRELGKYALRFNFLLKCKNCDWCVSIEAQNENCREVVHSIELNIQLALQFHFANCKAVESEATCPF